MRYLMTHPRLGPVSAIVFGCASIGGRVGKQSGLRTLGQAADLGINAFDTARSYGFGDGERILGEFLRGRREQLIVIGKAGIEPVRATRVARVLRSVARHAADRFPPALLRPLRAKVGTAIAPPPLRSVWEPRNLRESLERSLRELRTERLDVFLLHAPPIDIVLHDDVFELLDRVRTEGKANLVGVSGSERVVNACLARYPSVVDATQYAVDATTVLTERGSTDAVGRLRILMQPFGGGRLVSELSRDPAVRALTSGDDSQVAAALLSCVFQLVEPPSPVLLSAWKSEHLASNARLVDHPMFSREMLTAFADAARAFRAQPP